MSLGDLLGGGASVVDPILSLSLRVLSVENQLALRDDPRLQYFSATAAPSSGRHSTADTELNNWYNGKCVLCGGDGAKRAYLLSGNHTSLYPGFGPPIYEEAVAIKSSRNFIPLCGSLGTKGTCHDAFDRHLLAILYNVISNSFSCYSLDTDFEKHAEVHQKVITFHANHRPYKRVLAVRAKKCFNDNPMLRKADEMDALCVAIDHSETASVGAGENDSSGGSGSSGDSSSY